MNLCICDLDGVIADNTKRFEKAASRKDWHSTNLREVLKPELDNPVNQAQVHKGLDDFLENLYWQRAFTPELVTLDTLIEGVSEALDKLYAEYGVIFLTSRPESMRAATEAWLEEHDISVEHPQFGDFLVMKPASAQFIKTTLWKVITVQMLHRLFQSDELLFIDDEEANRQAVLDAYPAGGDFGIVRVRASLIEAVQEVNR